MKHILIVQGGGRANGNTARLAESFARGAESAGHSVETVSLIKNEVKGCLGCNACRYGKPCVQKDSFNQLIPKIQWADCIVLASPLYFSLVRIDSIVPLCHFPTPEGVGIPSVLRSLAIVARLSPARNLS